MAHHFKNLDIWKRSVAAAITIIKQVKDIKPPLWGLRDQIIRSAVSIPSNIAEGSERNTNKDFNRFLSIAKGSSAELRTQLFILSEVDNQYTSLHTQLDIELTEISNMTEGLMKKIVSIKE
ncbi:MAG: four helix bundle protein [Bacteroidota bacterium]